jgi:hypothetical protein
MATLFRCLITIVLGFASVANAQTSTVQELDVDDSSISMISVSGVLDAKVARKLKNKLLTKFKSHTRTAILVNSNGGVLEQVGQVGDSIIQFANAFYNSYGLTTIVVLHQECSSACTLLAAHLKRFHNPTSLEILASQNTEFTFHGPRQIKKGRFVPFSNPLEFEKASSILYAAYLNVGISARWLEASKTILLDPEAEATVTAAQLCKSNVGFLPPKSCVKEENLFLDVETALATDFTYFSNSWKSKSQ